MSKRSCASTASRRSSAGVSRSNSSVPSPRSCSARGDEAVARALAAAAAAVGEHHQPARVHRHRQVAFQRHVAGGDAQRHLVGAQLAGQRRLVRAGLRQQPQHLVVGDLREVVVPLADGAQLGRRQQRHHAVRLARQRAQRVGRGDGHGQHHRLRPVGADGLDGRAHRAAGGDAVVDEQHGAAPQHRRRPAAAEQRHARLHLAALRLGRFRELLFGQVQLLEELLVPGHRAALGHRAHAQLGLPRHAQLPHHPNVQRRPERARHLETHRHAAARQRQHQGPVLRVAAQLRRQLLSCVRPVSESNGPHGPPRLPPVTGGHGSRSTGAAEEPASAAPATVHASCEGDEAQRFRGPASPRRALPCGRAGPPCPSAAPRRVCDLATCVGVDAAALVPDGVRASLQPRGPRPGQHRVECAHGAAGLLRLPRGLWAVGARRAVSRRDAVTPRTSDASWAAGDTRSAGHVLHRRRARCVGEAQRATHGEHGAHRGVDAIVPSAVSVRPGLHRQAARGLRA